MLRNYIRFITDKGGFMLKNSQRILLSIYIPFTILILLFDRAFPNSEIVQYTRYVLMVSLALSTAVVKKRKPEQKIMSLSFLFLVIADFFLVFSTTIDRLNMDLSMFGILGFMLAYICLILAYQRNFKLGKEELLAAVPVVGIFSAVYLDLFHHLEGIMAPMALVFGSVLSYMTWTAICTVFRGYFPQKTSYLIAISGILMYICDIGVAYSLFHPYYSSVYVTWLKNIVWAAYIPGWTLLALVINEDSK